MNKRQLLNALYWIVASLLMAILLRDSLPSFWNAWLIALFLLPAALVVKFGVEKTKTLPPIKKGIRYFFLAVLSLFWGYLALLIAYWYILELNAGTIEKTVINPFFIWILIGFFVLLEKVLFKTTEQTEKETISIFSNRKKTVILIQHLAYIESRGDFTIAILTDGTAYKNTIKISEWSQKLESFLRIHRAFLVNPNMATLSGNEIIIDSKTTLPISRTYKRKVEAYFNAI